MRLQRFLAAGLMVAFAMMASVQAEEACQGGCPISKAMNELPKLTYSVGSEQVCCPQAAAKLAEDQGTEVTYLVGKKSFDSEATAMVALTEATEKFVSDFATPCKCDVSGKTTVAGKELCCDVSAAETAKVVTAAMEKVALTYKVGDKACHCPVEAESVAKKTGEKTLYVVAGEETCCNVQARLNLARAKYKAAVEALVASQAKPETETAKL